MGTEAGLAPSPMPFNAYQPTGWGLSIEGVRITSACVSSVTGEMDGLAESKPLPTSDSILPSLLLPRIPQEPVRLQTHRPLHPRGGDDVWPPESAFDPHLDGPRVPVAFLWNGLADTANTPWRWKTPEGSKISATAASLLAQCIRNSMGGMTENPGVVVIPNCLRMEAQQQLLDETYRVGLKVKLLWRPIAAALVWCHHFKDSLAPLNLADGDQCIGNVLSLHLGLDECEITTLEVVQRRVGDECHLLPARRRPDRQRDRRVSFGLHYLIECTQRFLKSHEHSNCELWQRLCGSVQPHRFLVEASQSHDPLLSRLMRDPLSSDNLTSRNNVPWCRSQRGVSSFEEWLRARHTAFPKLLGVVVSGELAQSFIREDVRLWQHGLQLLGAPSIPKLTLVDDFQAGTPGILAEGAAIHSKNLLEGRTSYLDTLPRIQTALLEYGTPKWFDLLSSTDEYVDGGRLWRRPKPLAGLHISRDQSKLELVLSHEEYPTVRKVSAQLRDPARMDIPVLLEVSIMPAQGNANVDVIPERPDSRVPRMAMEWRTMEDVNKTPEAWINEQPTTFPPLIPRAASESKWQAARSLILHFLGTKNEATRLGQTSEDLLKSIIQALSQKDQNPIRRPNEEITATAFSSEGTLVRFDDQLVDNFIDRVLGLLSDGSSRYRQMEDETAVRVLAYTSTPDPRFQEYLEKRIKAVGIELQAAELMACGRCLRSTKVIATFASTLRRRFRQSTEGTNNWLRALGEILRYRYDATKDIDSATCLALLEKLLVIFEREASELRFQQVFRNSCICIACLLRRRMFDPDFLELETPSQVSARDAFVRAINHIKSSRRHSGGTISIQDALQDMLNCIDKKGPSLLKAGKSIGTIVESDE